MKSEAWSGMRVVQQALPRAQYERIMIIIRDEKRIARLKRVSQYLSLLGLAALVGGLIIGFTLQTTNVFLYQLIALSVGWLLSQVGIYLAHRYVRNPRPDEVLDEAVKKVARHGRLYHYLLPAPHVLLMSGGIVVLVPKYQGGNISVQDDKWKQTGMGLRKFFGQEGLGNPTREAEDMVRAMAAFINKHAPEVEEVPIGALIVFTGKGNQQLDLKDSRIPAMHFSKVKGFLRQQRREATMPEADYQAIRAALDQRAGHLLAAEARNGDPVRG